MPHSLLWGVSLSVGSEKDLGTKPKDVIDAHYYLSREGLAEKLKTGFL